MRNNKLPGAFIFEFTLEFHEMKMHKIPIGSCLSLLLVKLLYKNQSKVTKVFFSCVGIAALNEASTFNKGVLESSVSFSCVETEAKQQNCSLSFNYASKQGFFGLGNLELCQKL